MLSPKLPLLFLVLFTIATVVIASNDEDSDETEANNKPAGHGGGEECVWTVPGTSRTYDLSGMIRSGDSPSKDWKAEEDIQGFKFDYYFNVCGDSIKGCNTKKTSASQYQIFGGTSAGCIPLGEAWSTDGGKNAVWGEFGNPSLDPKSGGVTLKYKNGQVCSTGGEKFSLTLKIPCGDTKRDTNKDNDGLLPTKFVVEQDSASGCEYTISFPPIEDGCPGSGHGSNWGVLFIGGLLGTAVVYLGLGIAFRVKKLGYSGRDAVPHLEFWESLPGLVMDGVRFSIEQTKQAHERFQESRRS